MEDNNTIIQQNDDDSSVESWSPTIKSRWRFSIEELRVLETTYHHSSNPRQEIINQLAYTLQCPKKTVTTWFQNRRAKLKRQRLLEEQKEQQKESLGVSEQQQQQQQQPSLIQQHYYPLLNPEIDGHYQEWLLQEQEQERQLDNIMCYNNINSNILQEEQSLSFINNTGNILTSQQQEHYNENNVLQNYPFQQTETRLMNDQQQQGGFLDNSASCLYCSMQHEHEHEQQYYHYENITNGIFPIDNEYNYCTTNNHIPYYNTDNTFSFSF
ncbi:hypothetical protein INT45_005854 [Circinella minor]|uniref:Homeobox domain-containing protein n=1 Tax=Circinella minor TaxID=1195481 RepID=A0A8H7S285_9FUNG|nr:hypothetical protein INT45_005854 [Circinella minor]